MVRMWLVLLLVACPYCASPALAQTSGDKIHTLSEWTVMLGHGLDAVSSQRAFAEHRGVEANPWLARFDDPLAFTTAKFAVGSVQLWLTRKMRRAGHPRLATVTNFTIGSGFVALGIRNERIGR